MKYLNIVVLILMVLFAAVQYNDPDGPLWVAIYMVPAVWAGLVAFKLDMAAGNKAFTAIVVCLIGYVAVMVYYWPTTPGFWHREVWWETETAREGMGAMIAAFAIAIAFLTVWRHRRRRVG